MISEVKALLVFCEGPHDVAYMSKVMEFCFGFGAAKHWKFKEYPSPFNQLFQNSVIHHAAKDLSLDMAHKFFLPDKVFSHGQQIVLIFNSGGKTQTEKISELLTAFLPLLKQASVFQDDAKSFVKDAQYLFLYDADDVGAEKTRSEIRSAFRQIDGRDWLSDGWVVDASNPFAAISNDKAIYIWGETPDRGSLEDLLHPLFIKDNADIAEAAAKYADENFVWNTTQEKLQSAIAETAKRKKAIITIMGQRATPGSSMSVVLDRANLIQAATWKSDTDILKFANFISGFVSLPVVP